MNTAGLELLLPRYRPTAWCIDRWCRLRHRRLRLVDPSDVIMPGPIAHVVQDFLDEHDCCGTEVADWFRHYTRHQESVR